MSGPGKCYIDDEPCDCGAMDVLGECPRDDYYHEDDELPDELDLEDRIELQYYLQNTGHHDDEIERL